MKKISIFLLALVTCAGTMFAEKVQIDDLYYNLDATNHTAEVTLQYSDYHLITSVNIPSSVIYNTVTYSVTSIGDNAFNNCTGLTSVTIPSSVTSIGDYAFYGCSGMTYVTIPNSVTSIGDWAFYHCSSLTSVTIPNSVTSIGDNAFSGCTGLTSVTIPNSVTSIGNLAFWGCTGLPVVDDLRYADTYLVEAVDKTLSSYTIKDGTKWIGNYVFQHCSSLTSMTIPNSVTSIGGGAFSVCTGLTSIEIPNSVTSIGEYAFFTCSGLTSVTIGNSVTSIGGGAFNGCSSLTSIDVASDNSNYCSVDGVLFNKDKTTLIQYSGGKQGSYTIPSSVTSIGEYAFSQCYGLTSVTIPNSVTSIGSYAFYSCSGLTSVTIPNSVTSIGSHAFQYCTGLTSLSVEAGNTVYDSRNNCNAIIETSTNTLIFGCQNTTIPNSVTSIGSSAFYGCSGLTSVTIPNSVTSIGYGAFYGCSNLTSVTIPNSVTSIGEMTFYYCTGLTSVTIPNSVTSIGELAFWGCDGLTSVTNYATTPQSIISNVFKDVNKSTCVLNVPKESVSLYQAADVWKDFGNIVGVDVPSEDPEEPIETVEGDYTINYVDKDSQDLSDEVVTLHVPVAPTITGFTFVKWRAFADDIEDGITIQAVYQADVPSSAPAVYTNPANPAQKLIRNGNVYILTDDKTYTITGQQVK